MAVTLRLSVLGKRGQAIYRIVAVEKRSKRNGKYCDELGTYDPNVQPPKLTIDKTKLARWQKNGAIISTGLASILEDKK